MTKLCFTMSSSNVLLGLLRVRVNGLGSKVDNVGNRGVGWNVICKLLGNECLVRNVCRMKRERPHMYCSKLSRDCS